VRRVSARRAECWIDLQNPPGNFAGKLLEGAGLKGRGSAARRSRIQHANFIVNLGGAQAADVRALIDMARTSERARAASGSNPR